MTQRKRDTSGSVSPRSRTYQGARNYGPFAVFIVPPCFLMFMGVWVRIWVRCYADREPCDRMQPGPRLTRRRGVLRYGGASFWVTWLSRLWPTPLDLIERDAVERCHLLGEVHPRNNAPTFDALNGGQRHVQGNGRFHLRDACLLTKSARRLPLLALAQFVPPSA
jgi:hypothetical protein